MANAAAKKAAAGTLTSQIMTSLPLHSPSYWVCLILRVSYEFINRNLKMSQLCSCSAHLLSLHNQLNRFLSSIAARGAASSTYFPIVAGINILYIFLRFVYYKSALTNYHITMAIILVGISCFAYKGILDDHANSTSSGGKGEALAGGLSLDLLGLAIVIEFGSFMSDYFYWLLGLIPVVGFYKLYTAFQGGKKAVGGFMPDPVVGTESRGKIVDNEKRQKRADRRRQKWN
jgi:hypothetical protein